jgi:hypothetical protein
MSPDQEAERARDLQRVINAYHRVFASEDGQTVLKNLKAYFRYDRPAFERGISHRYCPMAAALRDGQREVILFIEHRLRQPAAGDDQTQPTTILKP